jgi:heptosyltransferase-2
VIRGGAIGDFVLTLPAIAALRAQFPNAHLEVLGYPHIVQLAVAGGLVNRVHSIEARALAGFFARGGSLAEDLAEYFSEFDLIISYLYDPDRIFETNVALCGGAQFIVGPHRPDEVSDLPAAQAFLKPLERLAIFDADPVPRLRIPQIHQPLGQRIVPGHASANGASGGSAREPMLALHPGSGGEHKNWPESEWAELLRMLAGTTTLRFLIAGGEAEGAKLARLAALVPEARRQLAENLPLPELAVELQGCAAFIGHDSGISHLAAALGLRGLVLWGETRERIWRPPSERVVILNRSGGLSQLTAEAVYDYLADLKLWESSVH